MPNPPTRRHRSIPPDGLPCRELNCLSTEQRASDILESEAGPTSIPRCRCNSVSITLCRTPAAKHQNTTQPSTQRHQKFVSSSENRPFLWSSLSSMPSLSPMHRSGVCQPTHVRAVATAAKLRHAFRLVSQSQFSYDSWRVPASAKLDGRAWLPVSHKHRCNPARHAHTRALTRSIFFSSSSFPSLLVGFVACSLHRRSVTHAPAPRNRRALPGACNINANLFSQSL